MVFRPRDRDSVYESLKDRLIGRIDNLSNFVENTFNYVWTRAFSDAIRENEIQAAYSQLSGWIDYAGGPITENDLNELGMDNVSADEINQYMDDEDLDELVKFVGVERDSGTRARGTVEFVTVSQNTIIPEGTVVGTQPDSSGNYLRYETEDVAETLAGDTTVTVDVVAEVVGNEYNTSATDIITYMPSPPTGVQSVTNVTDITGGLNRETNDELRSRAKEAVFSTSGGGTSDGIIGYITQNTDARTVIIDEFYSQQPPYVDVVVDGGIDTDIQNAIDQSRPVGIEHNLVRPDIYGISISIDVEGTDIDTSLVESNLIDLVNNLGISDNFYRDRVYQIVFNSDEDITNTVDLVIEIEGEVHTYDSAQSVYDLDKGEEMDQDSTVSEITGTSGGTEKTFVKGTDYSVVDSDSNGTLNAIDWSIGGDSPDDGSDFYVDYVIENDITFESREKANAGTMSVTVV